MNYNIDYTISGQSITFTVAPINSAVIHVIQYGIPNVVSLVKGNAAQDLISTPSLNSTTPLTLRGASAQTAPLLSWQSWANAVLGVIDPNGKIGIGTTSPQAVLHSQCGTNGISGYFTDGTSVHNIRHLAGGIVDFYTPTGSFPSWHVGSTEIMRISAAGYIGIQNTNPVYPLDVTGLIKTSAGVLFGSTAVYGYVKPDNTNQNLVLQGNNAITFNTNITEAARFDTNQNLLIGYTTSQGSYRLQVNGQIYATNSTIATSDISTKYSITPLTNCLDLVCNLEPVHYLSYDDTTNTVQIGLVAQQVESALIHTPYLRGIVHDFTPSNSPAEAPLKALAYERLIPLLIQAIKELREEVTELRANNFTVK